MSGFQSGTLRERLCRPSLTSCGPASQLLPIGRVESAGLAATNTLEFGTNEQTEHALDAAASLQSFSQAWRWIFIQYKQVMISYDNDFLPLQVSNQQASSALCRASDYQKFGAVPINSTCVSSDWLTDRMHSLLLD